MERAFSLRAERVRRKRRAHAPRRYLLSPAKAASYAAGMAAMVLVASVDGFGGALALGMFAGLCYAGQNMLIVAPVYLLSVIAFSPTLFTLLYTVVPVVAFAVVYIIFYRMRKNVSIVWTTVTALLSELPHAVLTVVFGGRVTEGVLSFVLAGVFAFCAQTICYAVLFRGIKTRFTPDELIAGGIVVITFAYAAACIVIEGARPVFFLFSFFLLLFAHGAGAASGFAFAVLAGIGCAAAFRAPDVIAFAALASAAAAALRPFTKWATSFGVTGVYALFWLAAAPAGWGWQDLIAVALGALAFVMLPSRAVSGLFGGKRGTAAAVGGILNRNRSELSARLMSVSKVFYDMSGNLRELESEVNRYTPERLAAEVSKNYCGRCPEREGCFAALGGSTEGVILPMANAALTRGKVTILDMPPFVTGSCKKMHNLASVVSGAAEAYRRRAEEAGGMNETKRLMSEQFAGVSLVLDSLARECGEKVCFGEEEQDAIAAELLRHNIVAGEIAVSGEGATVSVALTVRASDADKLVLPRIVSACAGVSLERVAVTPRGDDCVVHLAASPVFEVAYGIAEKSRGGEKVSGDTKSVLCPSRRRRLFALSDGMGSGEHASRASRDAIAMVENFYRAGFDNAVILTLVNKLLCLTSEENFSSLDIAVVDTVSGGMDIIKMGAVSTFVCHRGSVEVISGSAPPVGILERALPLTCRRQLYDGDIVIMMSDGVYDALDEQGVIDAVEEIRSFNPQVLADRLLERALGAGAQDDCTVMVMRLVAR